MTTELDNILQQQEEGEEITPPETTETPVEESKDVKVEETPPSADEVPPVEPPSIPQENIELNELRQFIREQRKEIAAMKAKLGRVKEQSETDDEGRTTVTYTPLEKLQIELHNVAIAKTPILEVLVEAMESNPKYSDIYEVCTKSHFDDIFEMAATSISRNEGRDFNEVLIQLELEVWKKSNPYKYMYGIIKENHPKYKGKAIPETVKTPTTTKPPETAKKVLEAKEAPGSIASLGAGDNSSSGTWTSSKIDNLDESELHQVPKDIYQKYMMGKLK